MWYSSVMPQCSNQRTSERAQLLAAMTHPSRVLNLDKKQSFVTPINIYYLGATDLVSVITSFKGGKAVPWLALLWDEYRIYPCIMHTFCALKKVRKLRCVLYTESFLDSNTRNLSIDNHLLLIPKLKQNQWRSNDFDALKINPSSLDKQPMNKA